MKLVDMLDLGSSAVRCGGSSPSTRTILSGVFIFTANGNQYKDRV